MRGQGRKAAGGKAAMIRRGVVSGGRRERKLGAFAGKISIAPDFDETPSEVIEAFEGK